MPRPAPGDDSTSTSRSSAPDSPDCGPPTTSPGRPDAADRGARGRDRRVRRLRSQRRLVLGAVPRLAGLARRAGRDRAATPRPQTAAMRDSDRRGRAGRRRRGHRRALPPAAARSSGPHAGPSWPAARAEVDRRTSWGDTEDELRLLDADRGAAIRGRCHGRASVRRTRRTARRSTRRELARGLADAVERRGVTIYEQTPVAAIAPGPGRRRPRGHGAGRARRPRHRGLHRRLAGRAARPGADLLADRGDRAAARRGLGRDRAGRTRDVHRPPAPDHLRPAHRRRPARVRRPRARRTTSARDPPRASTASQRVFGAAAGDARRPVPGAAPTPRSPTRGVARSACPRLVASVGLDRHTGIGWAGGYVGDGVTTTNLAGRTLADLVLGRRRPTWSACPGSTTARDAGSPSRCAGWASTPACARCRSPTGGADDEEAVAHRPRHGSLHRRPLHAEVSRGLREVG